MSENINNKPVQEVTLRNRAMIRIDGIASVDSFDETRICATCLDGSGVYVEGSEISIKEVNLENNFVEAVGRISGFFYEDKSVDMSSGFFKTIFRKK